MISGPILDLIPVWLVFALTAAIILSAIEVGYRVGVIRSRSEKEREAPIDSMVGSTLGLLAFMMAFTFGNAASRFDARKQLVVDEANAVRNADLRAQLIAEPRRTAIRTLLLEYVDVRLRGAQNPGELASAIKRSEEIHKTLWSNVVSLQKEAPSETAPLAAALIEVINQHTKRMQAVINNRIHDAIWLALYSLVVLAMGMLGYRSGMAKRRSHIAIVVLALAFSAVLSLINDLDRPQQGFLRVNQQALIDLQSSLRQSISATTP